MTAPRLIEADICIVGSGITAAMVAARLADDAPSRRVVVIEAGGWSTPAAERPRARDRWLAYGENPWHRDHLDDQNALGTTWGYSPNLHVGGLAQHWGAVAPRYAPEDFRLRSTYGVGDDWPISYEDLEPFWLDAERRMGVAGERGPAPWDARTSDYPLPPLPVNPNLALLREAAAKADVPAWSTPSAKNSVPFDGRAQCQRCDTCYPVCPTGAKYTPDVTWRALLDAKRIELVTNVLVRRLEADPRTGRIVAATGNTTAAAADGSAPAVRIVARDFVLAAGFVWTAHLLLLSADPAHPDGLANASGLVGRYLAGHRNVGGYLTLPGVIWPGINQQHSLVSHKFMRAAAKYPRFLRHDLRLWESAEGRGPRGRAADGSPLYGDALLADWRARAGGATARIRAYYDVLPHRESRLVLDPSRTNRFGDPMPRLEFRDDPASAALRGWQEAELAALFGRIARAAGGSVLKIENSANDLGQEHPAGGCRMGTNPNASVCDPTGRTHQHENLWIAGAPVHVSAGCCNGTLTFAALGLWTAAHLAGTVRPKA